MTKDSWVLYVIDVIDVIDVINQELKGESTTFNPMSYTKQYTNF